MTDINHKIREPDRTRINTMEDEEILYWTQKFGISRQQLLNAIKQVGNSAETVQRVLGK